MARKTDLVGMFPQHIERALRLQQENAPHFMTCPGGHRLPRRFPFGRCAPHACVQENVPGLRMTYEHSHDSESPVVPYRREMDLLPRGLEGEAYKHVVPTTDEAVTFAAESEELLALMRAMGQKRAREAFHDFPDIPKPPDATLPPREYVKERLEQIAPLALETRIFEMLFGSGDRRERAAEEILDRAGHPRRAESAPDMRGPVVILNMGAGNPYEAQVKGKTITVAPARPALPEK